MIKFNKYLLVPSFANGKIKAFVCRETLLLQVPSLFVEKPANPSLKGWNTLRLCIYTLNKSLDGFEAKILDGKLLFCPETCGRFDIELRNGIKELPMGLRETHT